MDVFAIFLPWMSNHGSEGSFLLIFSGREDLVIVSWKSDARQKPTYPSSLWSAEWEKSIPLNESNEWNYATFPLRAARSKKQWQFSYWWDFKCYQAGWIVISIFMTIWAPEEGKGRGESFAIVTIFELQFAIQATSTEKSILWSSSCDYVFFGTFCSSLPQSVFVLTRHLTWH